MEDTEKKRREDKEWPTVISVVVRDEHARYGARGWIVAVIDELRRAAEVHEPFRSLHEAYAVIDEERDELWDAVRMSQGDPQRLTLARRELVQLAAMALRALLDVQDGRSP